ncbi:glycine betaine/proline transport system substrate-binding protein [Rhizobium sp. PP-F2F-G48]|uniref:ABC transporter substrate-binding protein n=1 Tax=Rhizobium sp. PP-F2F-G48 TaxID=2135651 RepID=UPI00104EB3F4|nr:ABC transporter substrate-binding protein [Rhizobium sp. PP-F2F-G48]TCM57812.1 glycine betaine/proline transport system substrate-binding protein [Rhizobium sp. PP-F2F-G48]
MKKLLASTCLTMGLFAGLSVASAAECGSVTIASMNWQSAEVISNLDKLILNEGYGCQAEITVGDTVPTITSMAEKGQPDIAPEAWVDLLPDVVAKGTEEGRIVKVGSPLPDGGNQGWWIPKYLADKHPDIKTIPDLLKHPDLFPSEEDPSKGAVLNGPQGWGGTVVTTQLFKAYDGEKANFTLVDTGSAAGLDGAIAKAYEREKGFAAYYWAPTALLGKYPMVKLDAGAPADAAEWKRCNTVADCPDPKPNAWPVDTIVTLVAKPFSEKAGPEVMAYLEKRSWSNETIGKLMAWMTDNQASGEDGAKHFLKENKEIWTKWVSADAAAKIEAAL